MNRELVDNPIANLINQAICYASDVVDGDGVTDYKGGLTDVAMVRYMKGSGLDPDDLIRERDTT